MADACHQFGPLELAVWVPVEMGRRSREAAHPIPESSRSSPLPQVSFLRGGEGVLTETQGR